MNRTQAVAKLKSYAGAIKALGATSLFLPPITSPVEAVRAAIVAEHRAK
jgi:hypothetical protein